MTLTGCAGFGAKEKPSVKTLTPIPGDLVRCFNVLVPAPQAGPKTKTDIVQLIVALKKSERQKSDCGKRLIAFYEAQL
jgi:hypothetical protein